MKYVCTVVVVVIVTIYVCCSLFDTPMSSNKKDEVSQVLTDVIPSEVERTIEVEKKKEQEILAILYRSARSKLGNASRGDIDKEVKRMRGVMLRSERERNYVENVDYIIIERNGRKIPIEIKK